MLGRGLPLISSEWHGCRYGSVDQSKSRHRHESGESEMSRGDERGSASVIGSENEIGTKSECKTKVEAGSMTETETGKFPETCSFCLCRPSWQP